MFYNYKGDSFSIGDCILVKATIADHREFKGKPFTYLNRVTVISNHGSKETPRANV